MRWLYVGLASVAALSIAAVVVALTSAPASSDLSRVKSAFELQTNCQQVAVEHPSSAVIVRRWAGLAVQSADVDCAAAGPRVTYAKFLDRGSLDRALAASQPSGGYCVLGQSIVTAQLVGPASTLLSDMCQSLAGTLEVGSD
jgi:hypothetical protein